MRHTPPGCLASSFASRLWAYSIVAIIVALSGCCGSKGVRPVGLRAPWCVSVGNAAAVLHWVSVLHDGTPVASGCWYEPEELYGHPMYGSVPSIRIWRDGRWQGLGNLDEVLCATAFASTSGGFDFTLISSGIILPNGTIYFCILSKQEAVLFECMPDNEASWREVSRVAIPHIMNTGEILLDSTLFVGGACSVCLLARSAGGLCVIPFHAEIAGPTLARPEESGDILKNVPSFMRSGHQVSADGQRVLFSTFTKSSGSEDHSILTYCFVDFGAKGSVSPCRTISLGDTNVPTVAAWPERQELVLSMTPRDDGQHPLRVLRIRGGDGEVEYLEPLPIVLQQAARNRSFWRDLSCTREGTVLLGWTEEIDEDTWRVGLASWTEFEWNVLGVVEVDSPSVIVHLNVRSEKAPILIVEEVSSFCTTVP